MISRSLIKSAPSRKRSVGAISPAMGESRVGPHRRYLRYAAPTKAFPRESGNTRARELFPRTAQSRARRRNTSTKSVSAISSDPVVRRAPSAGATGGLCREAYCQRCRVSDSRSSCVTRATETAEDLPSDRVIPVSEGVADRAGAGRPRSASQHLVVGTEELLGVFLVGKGLKSGIAAEVTRCPFPDIADHSIATNWRNIAIVSANRCGVECKLIDVC